MELHDTRWTLAPGQLRRLDPATGGRWLAAAAGRLWLTQTGGGAAREADVWLQPGQRQWLPAGSEWLIEGAGPDSAFELLEAPPISRSSPPAPSARPAWRAAPRAAFRAGFPWRFQAPSSS
jgi:hypothetical protein